MKTKLLTLCLLTFLISCGNGKIKQNPFVAMAGVTDSTGQVHKVPKTSMQKDCLRPTEADELFDDFVFNYASDTTLQRQRTYFPLPYVVDGEQRVIKGVEWEHDSLFLRQNMYLLLFDRETDMDIVGDTALTKAKVEWFYLKNQYVKRYNFERNRGIWMLTHVDQYRMENEDRNGFRRFYARFVTDSLYQRTHVRNPLPFITLDPDDEFDILETTLDINQWFAFRPAFPMDSVAVIDYGQKHDGMSTNKIVKMNGIGNGFSNVLYFRQITRGEWQLCKFEDTSI